MRKRVSGFLVFLVILVGLPLVAYGVSHAIYVSYMSHDVRSGTLGAQQQQVHAARQAYNSDLKALGAYMAAHGITTRDVQSGKASRDVVYAQLNAQVGVDRMALVKAVQQLNEGTH